MAWGVRSPGVLMTAYVAVFIYGGPWLGSTEGTAYPNLPQIAIESDPL